MPNMTEEQRRHIAALNDGVIRDVLEAITGVMEINAYPDYGPDTTPDRRTEQLVDVVEILTQHGVIL